MSARSCRSRCSSSVPSRWRHLRRGSDLELLDGGVDDLRGREEQRAATLGVRGEHALERRADLGSNLGVGIGRRAPPPRRSTFRCLPKPAAGRRHLSERLGGGDANRRGVVEVKAAIHLGPLRDERGELLRRARVVTGDELDELAQRAEFRGCVLLEEVLQDAAEVGVELDRSVVVRSREVLRAGVSAEADAARGRRGGGGSEFGRAGRTGRRAQVGTRRQWREGVGDDAEVRSCGEGARTPANAAPPPKPPRGGARRGRSGRALRLIFSHDRPVAPAREGEK